MERHRSREDYQPQLPLGVDARRAPRPAPRRRPARPMASDRRTPIDGRRGVGDRRPLGRTGTTLEATPAAPAPAPGEWRIDEPTRLAGRQGLAAARAALARSASAEGATRADAA